ncbi:hypothetical protein Glove_53g41 [Diversispora epigaea]|uniref:REJ domain-containing protein n=1 Tax=Diversispora epigaea TaxID=1348612 RepID=A0A397JP43_9GLOM|nr:hypothetical protein Glove_53g41 [Diversispora epigaea]
MTKSIKQKKQEKQKKQKDSLSHPSVNFFKQLSQLGHFYYDLITKKKNKKASSSSLSLSLSSLSSSLSSSSSSSSSTTSSSEQVSQSLISSSSSDEDKKIKPLDDESYKRIKREVFLVVDSEMNTVHQINDYLTWAAQKHNVITKLLPSLKRKINKKYKVTGAEITKILQRRHRSRHRVNNIGNQGSRVVINDSRQKLKNTAMSDKKKRRRRAVDFMMQGGNNISKFF